MQWQDYEQNIKTLVNWYKKSLSNQQHEILFKQIQHLPAAAFKDIVEDLINDSRYFPTITEIKNRYWNWRSANPDQATGYKRTLCLDCHGKGFIWTSELNKELQRNYTYIYRCGTCQNWQGHVHPGVMSFIHRSIAEKNGVKIIFPKHRAKCEDDLRPMKTNYKPNTNGIKELKHDNYRNERPDKSR